MSISLPLRRRVGRGVLSAPLLLLAAALVTALLGVSGSHVAVAGFAPTGKLSGLGAGARIWNVAFNPADPNQALAATDNGVYRSGDSGQTWTVTSLVGVRVWQVGFDIARGSAGYAAVQGHGVSRSSDGGATWTDASAGLGNLDSRVLAFGAGGIALGTGDGVALSLDGTHWRRAGLEGYSVSSIAVAANAPQLTLIAGVDGGNLGQGFLFRNTGGGITWEVLRDGLPVNAVVSSVSAGPLPQSAQKRPLVVTTDNGTFHSLDGGTTWSESLGIPKTPNPVQLTTSAFSPTDPNLVYVGSDGGGSSGGALLRSTDSGANFSSFQEGLPPSTNVLSLAVAPAKPPIVLAALDSPGATGSVDRLVDSSAPPPAAIQKEGAGAPIPVVVPTPVPTLKPTPRPSPTPAPAPSSSGPARLVHWPIPLAIELLVLIGIAYAGVRWRQRYLAVEGPPDLT